MGPQLIREEKIVVLPILREPSQTEISQIKQQIPEAILKTAFFPEVKRRPRNLEDAVRDRLPAQLLEKLPHSFDVIGDVLVAELCEGLENYSAEIGEAILKVNSHVRIVLGKRGETSGRYRTRQFEVIAGSGGTETVHHEFSCSYKLDVSTVYFNPRLSHERMRVAQQVKPGERIVDMFAGVGPYSILIAKLQPHSTVYSADINPEAVKYLRHNAFANQVGDRVIPILGDIEELAGARLRGISNRLIMNHPSRSTEYLHSACEILNSNGGVIHFYAFANREDGTEKVKSLFESAVEAENRTVDSFGFCKVIKEVGPKRVQVAIDAVVR
jgi:tRNA (guanine37-N1)-methyltransferase